MDVPDDRAANDGHAERGLDGRAVGFLIGLLVGEGHFGGDGRQPHVTLRMHVRHERTFRWLERSVPGSRLYGPYHHGGRSYFQWMARGAALREVVAPLVHAHRDLLDDHVRNRFDEMVARYALPVDEAGASGIPDAAREGGARRRDDA